MNSIAVDATALPLSAGAPGCEEATTRDMAAGSFEDEFRHAKRGDRAAFERIYERFVRVVHGLILARVGTTEAEDLAQEAFMAIYRGLEGVRDPAALPSWVCTVARNTATDYLRHKLRRPAHESLAQMPARRTGDDAELRADVLALICSLPDAYRETLVLRLVEGLSGPEIAQRTGLTPGSVRVNLSRGMGLLRPMLRKGGWS